MYLQRYKSIIMKNRGTKVSVYAREKYIQNNKKRCYLDFNPAILDPETKKLTRRLFLRNEYLYSEEKTEVVEKKADSGTVYKRIVAIINPKTGKPVKRSLNFIEQQHNKETRHRVEQIRARYQNELLKPEIYSDIEIEKLRAKEAMKGNFVEYFKALADLKAGTDRDNWKVVHKYLSEFTNGTLEFSEINEKFCIGFRDYLLNHKAYKSNKRINQNSACTYFVKFKAGLRQAYKDKKIPVNLATVVPTIKIIETQRDFLTLEEVNKLARTPCTSETMKRAALFSVLTGLRKSDILKLRWGEIEIIDDRPVVRFRQQKTKGVETLWISEQTFKLLGKRGDPGELVFPDLKIDSYNCKHLFRWLGEAGISKHISWHNLRHTYATLQLSEGTDIYTVSKLLGHRNIRTTQIYAKVVDKLKQEAADRIKLDI